MTKLFPNNSLASRNSPRVSAGQEIAESFGDFRYCAILEFTELGQVGLPFQ